MAQQKKPSKPAPSKKAAWPVQMAEEYYTLREQLNLLVRLIERAHLLAMRKNRLVEEAAPLIRELTLRLIQTGLDTSTLKLELFAQGGGRWVSNTLDSIEYFGPLIRQWAGEVGPLVRERDWPLVLLRTVSMRQAADQILFGYQDSSDNWQDGLLCGRPPLPEVAPVSVVDDSYWADSLRFLGISPDLTPAPEALIKRQPHKPNRHQPKRYQSTKRTNRNGKQKAKKPWPKRED